jgi:hypothetical protein
MERLATLSLSICENPNCVRGFWRDLFEGCFMSSEVILVPACVGIQAMMGMVYIERAVNACVRMLFADLIADLRTASESSDLVVREATSKA